MIEQTVDVARTLIWADRSCQGRASRALIGLKVKPEIAATLWSEAERRETPEPNWSARRSKTLFATRRLQSRQEAA
jgi:hypothetical protein